MLKAAQNAFLGGLDGATLAAAAAQRVNLRQRLFSNRAPPIEVGGHEILAESGPLLSSVGQSGHD